MTVDQLVLPVQCRKSVLKLAHEIPLAGHMGWKKTAQRILQRFYWPSLFRDVKEFCEACGECQKTAPGRKIRAPLIPLPVIDESFHRIAMDIVGPLPRSRAGNKYILVICDYATRYPEAIPLRSTDAGHVAEELLKVFARVGVPKEILTDQGSNFTSNLLAEVYRLLHIQPIRTSPYHPQTDGLVERFNQTLKAMLRRAVKEEGKDWDKLVPYVLFAYREVPQSSTGFSPFELLYGRPVRGPLDILRESWEASKHSSESIVSYVLSIQEKLVKMSTLAQENLARAQVQQKRWYDRNAREREFQPGEHVLVLLPTSTHKLRAEEETEPLEDSELPLWKENPSDGESMPTISERLSSSQKEQLRQLREEFADVMSDQPGRTTLAEHRIETGSARPVRLPPYRLPHAYREC